VELDSNERLVVAKSNHHFDEKLVLIEELHQLVHHASDSFPL